MITTGQLGFGFGEAPSTIDGIPRDNGAVFSDDRMYRYVLARRWGHLDAPDENSRRIPWCLINPSVADEVSNDQTANKVRGFSERAGFEGAIIVNPCAYVETKLKEFIAAAKRGVDVVGPDNDLWISRAFRQGSDGRVVVGWGAKKSPSRDRAARIVEITRDVGVELYCFGTTKDGYPQHPLMTGYAVPMTPWRMK